MKRTEVSAVKKTDTIKNNGDDKTVIICPVGPIFQYPIFAEIVNKERISLKNCWFISDDESMWVSSTCFKSRIRIF